MCERNINQLPLTCPQLGTWPATQARALTGNQTGEPLVCRLALNLSHTSQGFFFFFKKQVLPKQKKYFFKGGMNAHCCW